jgi:multimeric flavodoxin WrbA
VYVLKVTAFLGSPRPKGNTDILTSRLVQGAEEAGHAIQVVPLRHLKIEPCIGCDKCWRDGEPCVLRDDMRRLYLTIAGSDVLVFATPVYWYGPTAIMKAFIDRLVPFNRPQGRQLVEGKSAILVTAYEEKGPAAVEPLVRMFEMSFDYLGLKFIDRIIVDGVGPRGAVLQRADALDRAREVGRRLGSQ